MASKRFRVGRVEGYLYLLPWLLGLSLFQLVPILHSLYMSFSHYNLLGARMSYAALDNYKEILKDSLFWQALQGTFLYVAFVVPLKIGFALFVALLLSREIKGIAAYRTLFYLPSIFGQSVAVAFLWKAVFMENGAVNSVLKTIGITGPYWLGDPKYALATVGLLSVWEFGSSMVIFLAGLKQIPTELYEAASIDGAGRVRTLVSITLPMITPMVFFNSLMQMINAFQAFSAPFVIYGGTFGPANSCLLIVMLIYREAFQHYRMGYASSIAWVLFVLVSALTYAYFKSQQRWVHYTA
jgi:ABC-type sugar transport system permease subunit